MDTIHCVKGQVMEFLENVQEARYFINENIRNEEVENLLDAETIQEISECDYEGIVDHPDYPDLDLEALEKEIASKKIEKTYKAIDLDEIGILLNKTNKLDYNQKKVVEIGIQYVCDLKKALKSKNKLPSPPLLTVLGGAGAGKSAVINVLK